MKRTVCVVTGTRAEYGLLYWLMKAISGSDKLKLQIMVTGTHLSPEFGLTYKEIEKNGFIIDKKIEMLLSADTPTSISKSIAIGMISFTDALDELKPDIIVLLGDRYELLSVAISALTARIPIAHIHGGETTIGVFDEAIRHSITKMSWLHFTAAEEYQKRVIQLGENPDRVFMVGGLGVDVINKTRLLSKTQLSKVLQFEFGKKNLLVTYHPVTLEINKTQIYFKELLNVLADLEDTKIIITSPNADTDSRILIDMINEFVSMHSERVVMFNYMGTLKYLSTLQFVDGIVGNSSSGLTEAPSFKIGTVNIGDRQKGRLKSESVIDCSPETNSIRQAINKLYNNNFKKKLKNAQNPYGGGNATTEILDMLINHKIPNELKKQFYDQ
jgi:GDP/UDP-N,N'-diacetylbacillosamine 2-epimerase (hydrolysing)